MHGKYNSIMYMLQTVFCCKLSAWADKVCLQSVQCLLGSMPESGGKGSDRLKLTTGKTLCQLRLRLLKGGVVSHMTARIHGHNQSRGSAPQHALEGALSILLHLCTDGLIVGLFLQVDSEINNRNISHRHAESHTGQLAIQLRQDLANSLHHHNTASC